MPYIGTQPNDVKKNIGVYTPNEILQLEKDGNWGGSLELIEEKPISAVSSAIFTNIKETVYDVHFLTVNTFIPSIDNTGLQMRFFENGVEENGSVYQYAQFIQDTTSSGEFRSTSATALVLNWNSGNGAGETGQSYSYLYNLGNSSKYSFYSGMENHWYYTLNSIRHSFGGGVLPQASTVDQIKIFVSSGTFSATAKLYGVKQI